MAMAERRRGFRIAARRQGGRAEKNIDSARLGHAEQAKPKPPAEIAEARVAFTPLAAGRWAGSQPNLVAELGPVDALKNEFERGGELQFPNHDQGRVIPAQGDNIATAELTLHDIAKTFEKVFDRKI